VPDDETTTSGDLEPQTAPPEPPPPPPEPPAEVVHYETRTGDGGEQKLIRTKNE
jgi:hypothetical protein